MFEKFLVKIIIRKPNETRKFLVREELMTVDAWVRVQECREFWTSGDIKIGLICGGKIKVVGWCLLL